MMLSIISYYEPFALTVMYCFYSGDQSLILSRRAKTYRKDRSKTRVDENRNRRSEFMRDGRK